MDASFIKPFIASIQNVFQTMLQLPITVGTPRLKDRRGTTHDVSGIIGLSGEVAGAVVLTFPQSTAESVVALFTGQKVGSDHPDFADAVGELVNMVSGGAKALFPNNKRASISVPSVVIGASHVITGQQDVPCVIIPCSCDCGDMALEVAILDRAAKESSPRTASARA